jgi:hypothetical protein
VILAALLIFVLTLALFSVKVVLVLAIALLLFGLTCLYAERRLKARVRIVDWVLGFDEEPDRVISDRSHPLWTFGARRGPEPPTHTASGRFR